MKFNLRIASESKPESPPSTVDENTIYEITQVEEQQLHPDDIADLNRLPKMYWKELVSNRDSKLVKAKSSGYCWMDLFEDEVPKSPWSKWVNIGRIRNLAKTKMISKSKFIVTMYNSCLIHVEEDNEKGTWTFEDIVRLPFWMAVGGSFRML